MIDKVFNKTISKQFEFDEEVASVFDDMLERSVPFYKQMQKLSISFANNFLKENSKVYDLGCSTASTLIELSKATPYNGTVQSVGGYTVESISNTLYTSTDFTLNGQAKASGKDVHGFRIKYVC